MPQLGLGTEIGRVSGGAYDSDALAYFARAGIASGTQTPSSYDNAASFNGTNQFLSRASNSTLQLGGTDFTISFWANASTNGYIIGGDRASMGNGYAVRWNASGFEFLYSDGAWNFLTNMPAAANTWNFVTYTLTGSTMRRYLNGSLVGTETLTVPIQTLNGSTFYLATDNSTQSFGGSLANTAIWKRALTASEVTQLFNNGAGRTYESLDSGLRNNLISWWALNQTSVIADSHGTNTLTNNGTPLVTATTLGPIITGYSDSRRLISDFVRGIKGLGLWNSMVCWPLRASQNASTTQTAFSLGGGGTFNAALIGNPAWTSTGIAGAGWPAAGGQYVSTTYAMPASPVSYYAAIMPTPTSIGTNTIYYSTSGINVSGRQFVLQSSGVQNIDWMYGYNGNWPPSSQSFGITRAPSNYNVYESSKFASWRIQDSSTVFVSLNNSQTSGAITGWDSSSPAGVLNIVAMSRAPVAFSCIFNTFVSNSLDSQISALYKQTLGLGLLLP
jgi:hypothetical protein